MADGGTDLLSAHRWKTVRNLAIVVAVLGAIGGGIFYFVRGSGDDHPQAATTPPVAVDAQVKSVVVAPPPDADSHGDIIALSHVGFFTINASAKTAIYIDDHNIGDTPIDRLPLKPGPHVVKAVGPKGKTKTLKIAIVGGRDDDEGTITW
jgi:hypothetical protein